MVEEEASIEEIEIHSPLRWPLWYVERYSRFTDTCARVGSKTKKKTLRFRNREPMILRGQVIEGTRVGTNFYVNNIYR